jgi:hypothetical protein
MAPTPHGAGAALEVEEELDGEVDEKGAGEEEADRPGPARTALRREAAACLAELAALDPQLGLQGPNNTWVLKPAAASRGIGIQCQSSLAAICRSGPATLYLASHGRASTDDDDDDVHCTPDLRRYSAPKAFCGGECDRTHRPKF